MKYIKRFIGLIKIAKNWPQILASRFLYRPIKLIKLRNGAFFVSESVDVAEISMLVDIWFGHVYDPNFLQIEPTDLVIDIGCNKGYFTVYAARKTTGQIYGFEPVSQLALISERNLEKNNLNNATIIQKALWSETGEKNLYLSTNSGGHSMRPKESSYTNIKVSTIRLDDFCAQNQIEQIDFLKLDCEGAEYDILLNLNMKFLTKIKKIAMETHDFAQHYHSSISQFLEKNNFKTKEKDGYVYAWRD